MLEPFGVSEVDDKVSADHSQQRRREHVCQREGNDHEQDGGGQRHTHRQFTRSDGTVLLFRMLAIRLHIGEVIDDVHAGRDETEQAEACQCPQESLGLEKLLVCNERGEDKDVLRHPLTGTHGFDQGF